MLGLLGFMLARSVGIHAGSFCYEGSGGVYIGAVGFMLGLLGFTLGLFRLMFKHLFLFMSCLRWGWGGVVYVLFAFFGCRFRVWVWCLGFRA